MSQDPQTPPPAAPANGGWVQTTPGAPPVPAPAGPAAPAYAEPASPASPAYVEPASPAAPPAPPYGAPSPLPPYAAPNTPAPGPAPVAPAFGAPAPSYGAAAPAYGVPAAVPPIGTARPGAADPSRPATLGLVALILALVAVAGASLLSALTGFAAGEGAMRHAIGLSPEGLENLSEQEFLALLSPVRDLVLWAEIGFWAGTVLGLTALGLGIAAIATRRGRGTGIGAVVVAVIGPVVYGVVVGACILVGMGAGAA